MTEVFLSTEKTGTALSDMAHDAAIVLSLAVQHSIRVAALAHSVKRDDDGRPASLIGLVLGAPAPILFVVPSKEFATDQLEPRVMALLDEAPTLADAAALKLQTMRDWMSDDRRADLLQV